MKDFDRSERLFKKQIFNLNRHLPGKRKTLEELLKEDRPHVLGADGTRHRFKWAELERIAKILPPEDHQRLKLPIYIEVESISSGAYTSGTLETLIVCSVLDQDGGSNEIFIYRPDLQILRKELPTTTQYVFLVR
jgi:uncharacterized protein (UPF0216 family)